MNLLSPDDIKKDRQESTEESMRRAKAIAAEESRLAIVINKARADAAEQIELIDSDWKIHKEEIQAEATKLNQEIASLRGVRDELLKPIDEIKATAQKTLSDAEIRAGDVERQARSVAEDSEKNQETAEALQDRKTELDEREKKIELREEHIAHEEGRLKDSNNDLSNKWIDYHQTVHDFNAKVVKLNERESRLDAKEAAQEYRHDQQNKWDKELDNKQRLIANNYAALERAKEQILGKK